MKLTVLTHPNSLEKGTRMLLSHCEENSIDLNSDEVLYFPIDRKISISKEEIESRDMMNLLVNGKSFKESIETSFDISDPFRWEAWKKGNQITSGYEQLINILFSLALNKNKKILVIDHIEKNLHVLATKNLLSGLMSYSSLSRIIVTAYQDCILERFKENIWKTN